MRKIQVFMVAKRIKNELKELKIRNELFASEHNLKDEKGLKEI